MDLVDLPSYADVLHKLKEAWQEVLDSQSLRIVLIEGESGSHKTDVIEKFLDETKAPCVFTGGYRIPEPYFPLQNAFESWMGLEEVQKHLNQSPGQGDGDWQSALTLSAQLLPVLRLTDPNIRIRLARWQSSVPRGFSDSGLHGAEGSSYPMTLSQLFTIALAELARLIPVVFFVDNLDLVDPATLEAFRTDFLPSWKNSPVLFVATFASIGDTEPTGLSEWIETVRNIVDARYVELVNLGEADIQLILRERIPNLDRDNITIVAHHVYRATQGNLAQIRDVIEWIQSEIAKVLTNPESIPSYVRLCQRWFVQLGELEQRILQIGSVQGLSFCSEVVADVTGHVLGRTSQEVDKSLNGLERKPRSFIRSADFEVMRGGNWYEFRGRRIHTWVYESIISEERYVQYHRETALALERVYTEHVVDVASLLAYHFGRGNLVEKSAEYYAQAARQSNERGDSQRAGEYAKKGLNSLASAENTPEMRQTQCQLFLEKGRALKNVRPYAAVEALEKASCIAQEARLRTLGLEVSLYLGEALLVLNDWERSFKRLSETIDLAIEQDKTAVIIDAMEMLRDQYYRRGEAKKFFELCDEKVKTLRQSVNIWPSMGVVVAEILEDEGWMYLEQGKPNQALRTCWRAQGFLRNLPNPEKYPEIHYKIFMAKADVLYRSRDVARALQEIEEAIKWADASRQRKYQYLARVAKAAILSHAGETEKSDKEYQVVLGRYRHSADWNTVAHLKEKYGDFLILTGKLSEAERLLQPLYEDLIAMENLLWAQRIRVQLAKLDRYMGKFHRSLTVFQQLRGEATARNDKVGQIALLNHLGNIYRLQNRTGEAERAHREAIYICKEIQSARLADSLYHLGCVHLTNWTHIDQAEEKLTEAKEESKFDSLDTWLDGAAEEPVHLINRTHIDQAEEKLTEAKGELKFNSLDTWLEGTAGEKKTADVLPHENRTGYIRDYNHIRLYQGRVFLCQNRLDASLEMLKGATSAALKVNDRLSSGLGYLNLGLVYLRQGKPDEALKMAKYALDELPMESWRKAEGHHLLARCYLAMGELEKAREHADAAKTRFIDLGLFHRVNQVESTELHIAELHKSGNMEKWRSLDEMELRFDFNHLGI